jgi:glycosyltransferase involved in cell wall biosynthesis
MKARSVLLLTTSFADLGSPDPGAHFLYTQALGLAAAGFRVHVMTPLRKGQSELQERDGITVVRFPFPLQKRAPFYQHRLLYGIRGPLELLATLSLFLRFCGRVRRYCRDHRVDLVWANWLQIGYMASWALAGTRMPLVTTLQGTDIRNFPRFLTRLMAARVPWILNMYGKDAEIRGWIDKFRFREIRVPNMYRAKAIGAARRGDRILVVGRLENDAYHFRAKGIGEPLFRILAEIVKRRPEARVTVIGDGSAAPTFRRICTGLEDRIEFTGWLNNYDRYLPDARIVIGASGHGGVTLDTVPYGIPVMISKHDPVEGFWEDRRNCLLFDPDDEAGFRGVIEKSLDDTELLRRIADQARDDFRAWALPVAEAGARWRDALETHLAKSSSKM